MQKVLVYLFIVVVVLSCGGCTTLSTQPQSTPSINIKEQIPRYSFTETKTHIAFMLKDATITPIAKFSEVVFDGRYLGYFDITDTVFLPKFKGSKRIVFLFSDDKGKKLNMHREFILSR